MSDCMIPRAADRHRELFEAINRGEGYDYANGGPVTPKPRIESVTWTDDYGREYHVVGRERLTAAEDEIARLTIDLAETERERQKVVEREAKTAEALRTSQAVVADVAAACGLNGSSLDRTVADAARRLIADTDALQRRAEWAESRVGHRSDRVTAAETERDAAVARAVKAETENDSLTDVIGRLDGQLPTPDATNPAHLRWAAEAVDAFDRTEPVTAGFNRADHYHLEFAAVSLRAKADRLEADQQRDDADEYTGVIAKVVEELTISGIGNATPSDYYEIAVRNALVAAGLLRGGDEQ